MAREEQRGGLHVGGELNCSNLAFDLGNNIATGWGGLQEVMARAGQEADQDVQVILDLCQDGRNELDEDVTRPAEDPCINLLPANFHRQNGTTLTAASSKGTLLDLMREASSSVKQFSQELTATASSRIKQLSQDLGCTSFNASTSVSIPSFSTAHSKNKSVELGGFEKKNSAIHPRGVPRVRSGTVRALQGLRFISKTTESADADQLWATVENRFYQLASPDGMLSRANFGACIGMSDSKEFAGRLFDVLNRRQGRSLEAITSSDLKDFWVQISDPRFDSRLQLFFDMCDKNADGRISEEEVKEVIALSASSNKLSRLQEQAEEYAALIMEELDSEHLGYIELWQLEALLSSQLLGSTKDVSNFSRTFSQNFNQNVVLPRRRNLAKRASKSVVYFLDENWQRIWVILLWVLVMAGVFAWKFYQYRKRAAFHVMGYCLCTAKGAAETLKLNMALVLLPVCRNTITWLRSTWLGSFVPFDDNINFHKIIAVAIAFGILLHAGIHLTCDFPRLVRSSESEFQMNIGSDFNFQRPSYVDILVSIEGITGVCMVILMAIAYVLASPWFRRNLVKLPWPLHRLTGFNAFWYSHHLFAVVYVLLIIHSFFLFLTHEWPEKTTWMYLAFPFILYCCERALRALRAGYYTVHLVKAAIYPGNVLALYMTKPPGFKYKGGMYTFLQCPEISPFEWHPFSLTSAPGDDYISVHIRTLGDWTMEMKRIFSEKMEPPVAGKSGLLRAECMAGEQSRFPKLRIDGPYGAPAQDYKKYDVLLLIGLGIGATPFISILKDMLHMIKLAEQQLSSVEVTPDRSPWSNSPSPSPRRRKKYWCPRSAYFYWVTKEQSSFDWFKGVMNEVAENDHKAVIEMHNYLTSVYEEEDARSTLITMLQSLHHAKNGLDIVSGTRVRTHFARPNWGKVLKKAAQAHKGSRIGVFYCGPLTVGKELDRMVRHFNHTTEARFEFHKENF